MHRIDLDDSEFPLVRVTFHGVPTEAQFDAYLAFLEKNLERCERVRRKSAILFDATHAGMVSAGLRQKQADWMRATAERSARSCEAYAFVIQSALVRGALTAILWLAPMPAPHRVMATVAEGEAFLREKLGIAGPARSRLG